jgi:hypothetical protein
VGEHYTKNTESVTAYCKRCQQFTQHRVDSGRLGPCQNPHPPTKAQIIAAAKRQRQERERDLEKISPRLFEK